MATRTCTGCGSALSSYNRDAKCHACQHKAAHGGPVWALDSPEFRAAIAACKPGAALAAIRKSAGLSQTEFATLLGWEQSAYVRAERGRTQTLYDIRELHRVADALAIPRTALVPLLLSSPGTASDPLVERDGDMRRRDVTKAAIGVAALSAFPAPAGAAAGDSGQIGMTQVRYLRSAVEHLNAANQQYGAAATVEPALQAYRHARSLLENASYSEKVGAALAAAVADLAGCAGWQAYDCDMQPLARQCYNDALVLAEQSGETGLAIRLLGNMTRQACHLAPRHPGMAREAVRFSDRAMAHSRTQHFSTSMYAHVATLDAIAQAAVGDVTGFERAVRYAWREVDSGLACAEEDPVWFGQYLTVAEIRANEAKGWRLLGEHDKADRLLRQIVADGDTAPLYGLLYRINLGANSAAQQDHSEAVAQGLIALDELEGTVKSARLTGELAPIRALATRSKAGGAAEFAARYDALRAA